MIVKNSKAVTPTTIIRWLIVTFLLLILSQVHVQAEASILTSIRNSDSEKSYFIVTVKRNRLYIEGRTIEEATEFYCLLRGPQQGSINHNIDLWLPPYQMLIHIDATVVQKADSF